MNIPVFDTDLFSTTAIDKPYPLYKAIRDLGPVVWLPRRSLWAIGRFDDVRLALRDDKHFISGNGVASNEWINRQSTPITLTSDDDEHRRRRKILTRPIMPDTLAVLRPRLEAEALRQVSQLAAGGDFDAVEHFAAHLPLTVVKELVGLNEYGRKRMLAWASATFNALGVLNVRGLLALPRLIQLSQFIKRLTVDDLAPDGWARQLFDAVERGELSQLEANAMVIDYVAPALDTTILATAELLYQLASTEGAFQAVQDSPALIPGVINEAVRTSSPIKGFTRCVATDMEFAGTQLPQGDRVLLLYASANRDERRFDNADSFDVHRNPKDHVGWGHGAHSCAGKHLARLEMEVMLEALVDQVKRIEIKRTRRLRHNVLQGFQHLVVSFTAKSAW